MLYRASSRSWTVTSNRSRQNTITVPHRFVSDSHKSLLIICPQTAACHLAPPPCVLHKIFSPSKPHRFPCPDQIIHRILMLITSDNNLRRRRKSHENAFRFLILKKYNNKPPAADTRPPNGILLVYIVHLCTRAGIESNQITQFRFVFRLPLVYLFLQPYDLFCFLSDVST